MSTCGTPRISQLAPYTTEYFRRYKPEEVWVIETWEVLKELGYRHVRATIVKKLMLDKGAVIVAYSTIETLAGQTKQKETYCFLKTEEGWRLNDLLIEEEVVEVQQYNL